MKDDFPYKDIIDLPHHQSAKRKHMSLYDRAAQFSAFAALSGYDDIIAETGRLTDDKLELPDDIKVELDQKLVFLSSLIDEGYRPEITVTYFIPDKNKAGGRYTTFTGKVKRIDSTFRQIIFYDKDTDLTGTIIEVGMIAAIDSNDYLENAEW